MSYARTAHRKHPAKIIRKLPLVCSRMASALVLRFKHDVVHGTRPTGMADRHQKTETQEISDEHTHIWTSFGKYDTHMDISISNLF